MVLSMRIFSVFSAFTLYYQRGHYSKYEHEIVKESNLMRGNKNLLVLELFMFEPNETEVPHQSRGMTVYWHKREGTNRQKTQAGL